MPRRDPGLDVEIEWPAGDDDEAAVVARPSWRRWAVVAAVAGLVVAALALSHPAERDAAAPAPTTAATTSTPTTSLVEAPAPEVPGHLVALVGDKLLVRPVEGGGSQLAGLVRIAGPHDLSVVGRSVVALGKEVGDDGRTGVWVMPTAVGSATYLGPAEAVLPSVRQPHVWVVADGQAREVDLGGVVDAGPLAVDGTVVGMAGAGLVLDRGGTIVWWPPPDGEARQIGAGRVLDSRFEQILWLAANGMVTLTDPNTLTNQGVLPPLPGEAVVAGAIAPNGALVAVMTSAGVHLVAPGSDEPLFVPGQPAAMVWASDRVLLVAERDGSLSLVAASGRTRRLQSLPIAPVALGFVPDP